MARATGVLQEVQETLRSDEADPGATGEATDVQSRLSRAFVQRGLDLASLSHTELDELEDEMWGCLSRVFDELVPRWQDEHGKLTEQERIDRELRRRIVDGGNRYEHDDYECEGCGHRHWNGDEFVNFHDVFLCDGCLYNARDELRDIQRPLIAVLKAEPTLEHAQALGFELTQRDGRLLWVSEDDDYDGGCHPYANDQEALEDLVEELTVDL
jgi:hypothetical protein